MQIGYLFDEIDCQWQIYNSLCRLNAIGPPLQPVQAKTHGQLVILIHGCKSVAEGSIIANHAGFHDDESDVDDQYGQLAFEIRAASIFLSSWIISH
jgi:hypothetical protein